MDQKRILNQLKELKKNSGPMRLAAEEWKNPYQILISTILSARTRDETTIPVSAKLFKKYSTIKKLAVAKIKDVEKIIFPVNFYRNKSKYIISCAKMLVKNYKSKVPKEIDELVKLPGVGRKTSNVFLAELGEAAIGVDTHVSYISQKIGWTKNKDQKKIEMDLKKLFPKKYWKKVNSILVRFGKTHRSKRKKDALIEEIKKIK